METKPLARRRRSPSPRAKRHARSTPRALHPPPLARGTPRGTRRRPALSSRAAAAVVALAVAIVAAAPAATAPATEAGVLEPWCERLLASHPGSPEEAAPIAARLAEEGRPFYAVDPLLLELGRVRLQLDVGPGAGSAETLRPECLRRVPSLDWEGSAGARAQVTLAIDELPLLAAVPGLFHARRPAVGITLGAVVSEGVASIGAAPYPRRGIDGAGVRIGVIDQGFAGLAGLLGTELPADTVTRSFFNSPQGRGDLTGGGIDHGTACAEVIHDVAPGAGLYLANAYSSVDLQAAVRWLRDEGVAVISHSVGWFEGGGDGTGPIHDIVAEAEAAGILWVNAAGNQALDFYGGLFTDADGDGLHEFDAAGDETISYAVAAGGRTFTLVLTWDRWPYSTDLAFDIEIRENGELVAGTEPFYRPPRYAYRALAHARRPGTRLDIAVRRTAGTEAAHLRLFRLDAPETLGEHATASGSLLIPADGARVLAAGAYRVGDGRLEDFSSRGPTVDGRAKPEVCGPNRVRTATSLGAWPESLFAGTSASAPHAAGAAALMIASSPVGGLFDFRWSSEETRRLLAAAADPDTFADPHASAWGLLRLPDIETGAMGPRPLVTALSPSPWPLRVELAGAQREPWFAEVLDAAGRRLLGAWQRPAPAGTRQLVWGGPAARASLPSGRYLLRVRCAEGAWVRPFVLLR